MVYAEPAEVKAYIPDLSSSSDEDVTELIAEATDLINIDLGDSIELDSYERRVDGLGVPRVIMENIVNQSPAPQVFYRTKVGNERVPCEVDYVDKNTIYTMETLPRGDKNIKVIYTKGYSTIPNDFKKFFLLYVKAIYDISLEKSATNAGNKEIKTKTLGDLSITYFSATEIMNGGYQANSVFTIDYNKVINKYKNFNFNLC